MCSFHFIGKKSTGGNYLYYPPLRSGYDRRPETEDLCINRIFVFYPKNGSMIVSSPESCNTRASCCLNLPCICMEFPISANQDNPFIVDDENKSNIQSGNRIMLDDYEHEDCINYIVIDELHEKFGPAVMHIQEQDVIGIGADVFGQTEQERLCWLQVATKNTVYLFDVLLLGGRAFKNGLSMILENPHMLKVIHDCRCVARCLKAQFGVNLTNVFDTQVADIMLFYNETGGFLPDRVSTLQEVVRLHLKVPIIDLFPLWTKEQQTKEKPEVWYMRPCPPALLKVMAVSVLHLLPLRLVLLDALMSDYTILVDSYMDTCHNKSVSTLHIGKTGIDLPKEVQELNAVRKERLEWATHCYSVTNDGFLERSSFRPSLHSDPHNTKSACPEPSSDTAWPE
ncbi:piRNA biogenesis protein EXD1 isoform X2 [Myxocyprinus asiaticus]|uniref:piRNA biogenesis protein EXD1 isoform X2 n=1 Tax=Myxocyprinus asiaticus TaxID=70543 RepID=UPI0022216E57|nr:piRNA biogenesis protein EXD1 isoform X2 [Myxocyprinus asiaticus]